MSEAALFFAGILVGLALYACADYLHDWTPEGHEDEGGFHFGRPSENGAEDEELARMTEWDAHRREA